MKEQTPLVSVVLATYQRNQVLVDSITDILQQDFKSFELIIVDQTKDHDAGTKKYLDELHDPRVRYVLVGPPSLTKARNYALTMAQAEIVLFLDDDIRLHDPKFLQHHYDAFQLDPEIVGVAGRVINADNSLFVQVESERPFWHDKYAIGHDSFNCPNSQFSGDLPGCNMAMKREAMVAAGGFDPSYKASAVREESDASFRLRRQGKIYFCAEAVLLHLAAPSGGTRVPGDYFDSRAFYNNDLLFALKTVRPVDLPISLAKRYKHALQGQSFSTMLRRSWLYGRGLGTALGNHLRPDATEAHAIV